MEWVLFVFLTLQINGLPAYVPVVPDAPVVFETEAACAAAGRAYVMEGTFVVCRSRPKA